jgi:hypothetical protein
MSADKLWWRRAEEATFAYLPDAQWMRDAGYSNQLVGFYELEANGQVYRLSLLSQTSRMILFKQGKMIASRIVTDDEQLLRLLTVHNFPLP